jgi:glycosyltransferase involved in cell wall biosynthesis
MLNVISPKTSKTRIGIFLPGLYGGGAERVMLNLVGGFDSHGYSTDLILVQAEGPYINEIPASVRMIELNKKHRSYHRSLNALPSLIHYLRSEKPIGIISCLNFTNILAVWAKTLARVPFRLVLSEQNTYSEEITQFPRYSRWIFHQFMKGAYPAADGIAAVSNGVADDLAFTLDIPRNRITVIFNPIITPVLQEKKDQPLDDPWFENNQPPVILAIGRLTKQKGFDILIRAFNEIKRQRSARLMILGEGEDRQTLTSIIKEYGLERDVKLPGFVSNPYPYLKNASMFVLSSRWEGLPTVLVEALYCETPIISTDCPSGPREILDNGSYGQLVPVDNIPSLVKAIISVLDGKKLPNTPSSWQAYTLNSVLYQYEHMILGEKHA